jgi:hypothetical protein
MPDFRLANSLFGLHLLRGEDHRAAVHPQNIGRCEGLTRVRQSATSETETSLSRLANGPRVGYFENYLIRCAATLNSVCAMNFEVIAPM